MPGKPQVDVSLDRFDESGMQTVFAISPFGASETRAQRIERMEKMGSLDPNCLSCREFYAASDPAKHFAPGHRSSSYCRSGGRPHCTCDACF